MTYDLISCAHRDDLDFKEAVRQGYRAKFLIWSWPVLLDLARRYGWQPAGTSLASDEEWDGSYLLNSGQTVSAEDAAQLADALARALPDLPEIDAMQHLGPREHPIDGGLVSFPREINTTDPFEMFSGRNRRKVVAFIGLCRRGAFVIK